MFFYAIRNEFFSLSNIILFQLPAKARPGTGPKQSAEAVQGQGGGRGQLRPRGSGLSPGPLWLSLGHG